MIQSVHNLIKLSLLQDTIAALYQTEQIIHKHFKLNNSVLILTLFLYSSRIRK